MKKVLILLMIPIISYGKEFREEPKVTCSNVMMRRFKVVQLMNEYEECKTKKIESCELTVNDKLLIIQKEARKITEFVSRNPKCNEAEAMMAEK